jgi:hypothetical protein
MRFEAVIDFFRTSGLEAPRELFQLAALDPGVYPYDVAGDGQRFLVPAVPQKSTPRPLIVIVNWPALMKTEAAAHDGR